MRTIENKWVEPWSLDHGQMADIIAVFDPDQHVMPTCGHWVTIAAIDARWADIAVNSIVEWVELLIDCGAPAFIIVPLGFTYVSPTYGEVFTYDSQREFAMAALKAAHRVTRSKR